MTSQILILILTGILGGIVSGFFGLGGGVIIVPVLVYFLGFSQQQAIGTSLMVLLPPVGLAAVVYYYQKGNVDIKAGVIIACSMFVAAFFAAYIANKLSSEVLRIWFGVFLVVLGTYTIWDGLR